MFQVRIALCVCACLPAFAKAEIVLEEPPPAPAAPVAPVAPAPRPAAAAAPIHKKTPMEALVAPPPPPRESAGPFSDRIKLKDGSERVGEFAGASAAGVHLRRRAFPRPVAFPWEQVAKIELNQTVPKAGVSEPHLVAFANGDGLPGQVVELNGDRLVVATWFAGKVEAKVAAVRRLGVPEPRLLAPEEAQRLAFEAVEKARTPQEQQQAMARYQAAARNMTRPAKPTPPPEKPAPGMRLVVLANGDKLQCSKFSIREGKAQVETASGSLEIPSARVRSCAWTDAGKAPAPLPGARTVRLNGPLGGSLRLRIDTVADGKMTGVSESLGKLELDLSAVAGIE